MVRHLGSSLSDMTYILDEPSTGLHPRDVQQLNALMRTLRDKGNTVLVVEHDPDVIAIADHIVDLGPEAGSKGGEIVFEGSLDALVKSGSRTGRLLGIRPEIKNNPRKFKDTLKIEHAKLHNLKNISVTIPKGVMTIVTGVAGSGKSSLINGMLPQFYEGIICINQNAIPGSKRSNTASYTGVLDPIRELFSKVNRVSASLFSSNSDGACPACKGLGITYTDLAFMDTIVTTCELCQGRRFTEKILNYRVRGKNISEVLKLTIDEALDFFNEKEIAPILELLNGVGLEYITLGQPLSSLSGGERQRIKLATEFENEGQIYILDEPTTGLHLSDIQRLIALLNKLVDNGCTVIVIEHNLDVISQADWIIKNKSSATGIFLKKYVEKNLF